MRGFPIDPRLTEVFSGKRSHQGELKASRGCEAPLASDKFKDYIMENTKCAHGVPTSLTCISCNEARMSEISARAELFIKECLTDTKPVKRPCPDTWHADWYGGDLIDIPGSCPTCGDAQGWGERTVYEPTIRARLAKEFEPDVAWLIARIRKLEEDRRELVRTLADACDKRDAVIRDATAQFNKIIEVEDGLRSTAIARDFLKRRVSGV